MGEIMEQSHLDEDLYGSVRVGDFVLVGFWAHREPDIFGIVIAAGDDSIDAVIFPPRDKAVAYMRVSGLWHMNDERVKNSNGLAYNRGIFKPLRSPYTPLQIDDRLRDIEERLRKLEQRCGDGDPK